MDYNFINALYSEAVDLNDPTELQILADMAKKQIFEGLGKQTISATINGKTQVFKINKSADELYVCARKALEMFHVGPRASIGFDFTSLRY